MSNVYQFPFGEYVSPVVQEDRTPKKVFVLGVYASAVHAKWVRANKNEQGCFALAVASEPRIFWDGNKEEAQAIIDKIKIPSELGHLELPNEDLNGPSAKALDEKILAPLGFTRDDTWLCDLLPETRLNENQVRARDEVYEPLVEKYGLNHITIPEATNKYCDAERVKEITKELIESKAEILVLLGNYPIEQYLNKVTKAPFNSLSEYVFTNRNKYGSSTEVEICGKKIRVLPLVHPHHIIPVKDHSPTWHKIHIKWVAERKKDINKI